MALPERSYRILILDGQLRPLAGMRLASDTQECEQWLADLRAMCPGETFTYETVPPRDHSLSAGS